MQAGSLFAQDFNHLVKQLLRDEYEAFTAALSAQPPVSIRCNRLKVDAILSCKGSDAQEKNVFSLFADAEGMMQPEQIPWCATGYYLPRRPHFASDPLFHAGVYYVQEASSMFLEQAVRTLLADPETVKSGVKALDLCAAPGGKSTHLLTLLPHNSLLVCNEVIRSRCMILAENIAKWGYANTIITQNDPKDFGRLPHFFDIIIADLPCSGEGMFRKNPDARNEWSIAQVKFCASRQRRIIRDVWEALKPGGYLIYSTCTFNTVENEDNVEALADELGAEIIPISMMPEWNIKGASGYEIIYPEWNRKEEKNHEMPVYRFFPHRIRGEGFFLALLRKAEVSPGVREARAVIRSSEVRGTSTGIRSSRTAIRGSGTAIRGSGADSNLRVLLTNPEKFVFRNESPKYKSGKIGDSFRDMRYALPISHESTFTILSEYVNILSAGLLLGEFKGDDFVPSTLLALSTELNVYAFPAIELTYEQAISYLQRETLSLPADKPKGFLLTTYRNIPLGFIKNTGIRANNLYRPGSLFLTL